MKSEHDMLIDEILQSQKAIFLEMQAAASQAWLDLDLTIAQIKAIFTLATRGPMTVGQVGSELGVGKPTASILVDRLVQIGLVDRTEDSMDRRRAIVHLTPQGEELVAQLRQGRQELLRGALAQMRDEELEALLKGSRALAASLAANRLVTQP